MSLARVIPLTDKPVTQAKNHYSCCGQPDKNVSMSEYTQTRFLGFRRAQAERVQFLAVLNPYSLLATGGENMPIGILLASAS
jgi:hypothetical protein